MIPVVRVALLASVAATGVSFAQQAKMLSGTGVISGRVVDGVTGRALRGVQVRIVLVAESSIAIPMVNPCCVLLPPGSGPYGSLTTSNDQGQFSFARVPAGSFELIPFRNGITPPDPRNAGAEPVRWFDLADGQQRSGIDLKYFQPSSVSGRLVDEQGTPVAGVEVLATSPGMAPRTRGPASELTSDDRGLFGFLTPPGTYLISTAQFPSIDATLGSAPTSAFVATHYPGGSAQSAARVTVKPGEERTGLDLVVRTRPAFRVSGTVAGYYSGQPTSIDLVPIEEGVRPEPVATARITGGGPFAFAVVPPGRYRLRALSAPNMPIGSHGNPPLEKLPAEPTLWAEVTMTVVDRDVQVTMDLQPGARIHGRIEFDGQAPRPSLDGPPQMSVAITRADGTPSDFRTAYTPDGRFSSIQIAPGRYILSAYAQNNWRLKSILQDGRDLSDSAVEIGSADIHDVVVAFADRRSTLTGRVLRQPPLDTTRGWVTIFPSDRASWSNYGMSSRRIAFIELGRAGTFEVELPPGSYLVAATDRCTRERISADTLARLAALATPVVVGDGQTTALDLRLRAFEGR